MGGIGEMHNINNSSLWVVLKKCTTYTLISYGWCEKIYSTHTKSLEVGLEKHTTYTAILVRGMGEM